MTEARNQYVAKHAEAVLMARELCGLIEDLPPPEAGVFRPTWANVGDLDRTIGALADVADRLAGRGEYAPENVAR